VRIFFSFLVLPRFAGFCWHTNSDDFLSWRTIVSEICNRADQGSISPGKTRRFLVDFSPKFIDGDWSTGRYGCTTPITHYVVRGLPYAAMSVGLSCSKGNRVPGWDLGSEASISNTNYCPWLCVGLPFKCDENIIIVNLRTKRTCCLFLDGSSRLVVVRQSSSCPGSACKQPFSKFSADADC
jgi:hypothetical protein